MQFVPGQHIHCIGIGGFGISAIARILLLRGFAVTGSDRTSNTLTEALSRDGATVYRGHSADYLGDADMVIATSAVGDEHVEIIAANDRGIPVYRRRDMLASLMEGQTVIAVAGTHGKTTTTSMIVHILRECGKDPSYIVGGIMASTGTNAGVGADDIFVIEADEYDNMFLGLKPDLAVITSVEYDHPDFFPSLEELRQAFGRFANTLSWNGTLVGCVDDLSVNKIIIPDLVKNNVENGDFHRVVVTYGIDNVDGIDVRARNLLIDDEGYSTFDVELITCSNRIWGEVVSARSPLLGKHNVLNALAALTVANLSTIPFPDAAKALETFQSTRRRFDVRGEVDGVVVVDDYAHHPTAIKVTLDAARMRYPDQTIWAVWQPHMYSRTQQLIDDYALAFEAADCVVVTDIYAAREDPIPGVDGAWVVSRIQHAYVQHTPSLLDAVNLLLEEVMAPAVILIMSAGDAPQIGIDFLKAKQTITD